MRTLTPTRAAAVAVAAALLLAPTANALSPATKGDNGTVKIHDAETDEALLRNEPKVCEFYLDAFHFDAAQKASWRIVEMPPTGTKGTVVDQGTITLDSEGHGRTADMTLENGHYKLIWNFEGEKGRAKHKVFWTACEDEPSSPPPSRTRDRARPASRRPSRTRRQAPVPAPAPPSSALRLRSCAPRPPRTDAWLSSLLRPLPSPNGYTCSLSVR
ncbi:hypothetical protein [Streptomyces sp. URMC 125]|uniref:hypothetical protein n=1 Tax=Streptomyces sp. URMC 125 TaxID=3423419 RepID=UPI003F1A70FB